MNKYIERVLADTKAKNANEPEFLQTVEEVLSSLEPVINAHPMKIASMFRRFCQAVKQCCFPNIGVANK